jgi:hypothetical protein
MAKGLLIVYSAPSAPQRDAEYNDWYTGTHLPDILSLAGFMSARRYKNLEADDQPYMAIYEVEADDLTAARDLIGPAVMSGQIRMNDCLQMDPMPESRIYELIAEL